MDNTTWENMMRFCRAYTEATTDPYEARDSFDDLEEGDDPMERAAQEVYMMIEAGMWEELAINLENAIPYAY